MIIGLLFTCSVNASSQKAIIVFDGRAGNDIDKSQAFQLVNLLGHFQVTSCLVPVSLYEKGDLNNYAIAFFVGTQSGNYSIPGPFLADAISYKGKFFWLGENISQLLKIDETGKYGITYLEKNNKITSVEYKGFKLKKGDPVLDIVKTEKSAQVFAYAEDGRNKYPYIIKNNNFWYAGDIPYSFSEGADRYLVFCDLLHDFLGETHKEKHMALIRIEDVNPTTDPEKIKSIADFLSEEHIPFCISLVPFFIKPDIEEEIPLSSCEKLVDALKYAVSKGGNIILHGDTHQYKGTSTLDFEFWDEENGKAIKNDAKDLVESKINNALQECFDCGLYPLLWETPHYAASSIDYKTIAMHFSTVCERRIYMDRYDCGQAFPFIIDRDIYGQKVIPEYLGYIPLMSKNDHEDIDGERKEAESLLRDARGMLCLRDGVGGFFIHPFLDISLLKGIVRGLKGMKYEFLDVKDMDNCVVSGDKAIVSGKGKITLDFDKKFLREFFIDEKGRIRKEIISKLKISGKIKKDITCRPRWIYCADGIDEKPAPSLTKFFTDLYNEYCSAVVSKKKTAFISILWNEQATGEESKDQEALFKSFDSLGIKINKIKSLSSIGQGNLLIIPFTGTAHLGEQDVSKVSEFLNNGGVLLLDGFSDLSRSLGFNMSAKIPVHNIKDTYNVVDLTLDGVVSSVTPSSHDKVIYQSDDGFILGLIRSYKRGGIVFLSTMYDPVSGNGYSRFPTLPGIVLDYFKFLTPVSTPYLEAYFDPGYRQSESVEILAKRWRKLGIRRIHVGAWHFYPQYTFDYKRLINVCHFEGISVYAWVELPYLNKYFWDSHPEFREKNYLDKDIVTSWRYPLALEDSNCKKAVFEELKKLFTRYNFDGVNLAELYFEGEGFKKPETFSPFHRSAQNMFKNQYGFDMKDLFREKSKYFWKKNPGAIEKFLKFRTELNLALHRELLGFLTEIRSGKGKDFEIVLTVVDSIISKDTGSNWAVDSKQLALLYRDFPVTILIEDPEREWNKPPERYEELKKAYLSLGIPSSKLAIDINVVNCHEGNKHFASTIQTGSELFEILRYASAGGNRVVVYGEHSIPEYDLPFVASALELPPGMVVPSSETDLLKPVQVLWSNGNISKLAERDGSAYITYTCPGKCYMAINKKPSCIIIDGKKVKLETHLGEGEWIVYLPEGTHNVSIIGEGRIQFSIEASSYFESRFIVIFGIISSSILVLLYLINRIRRSILGA